MEDPQIYQQKISTLKFNNMNTKKKFTVTLGHLGAVNYTGSSMNPARTFGTAFVTGQWENHFVYWIGPILGGLAASLLYSLLFVAPEIDNRSDRYHVVGDEREVSK